MGDLARISFRGCGIIVGLAIAGSLVPVFAVFIGEFWSALLLLGVVYFIYFIFKMLSYDPQIDGYISNDDNRGRIVNEEEDDDDENSNNKERQ